MSSYLLDTTLAIRYRSKHDGICGEEVNYPPQVFT